MKAAAQSLTLDLFGSDQAANAPRLPPVLTIVRPAITMGDLLDRYQREIVPTFREATQDDYGRLIRHLKAAFGHKRPQDILPRDIGAFLDVPTGKVHRNKLVSLLSTVFNKSIGRWFIEGVTVNPCVNVERNPTKKRDRYISHDEYQIVHAGMTERVQIIMDLALITGQRQGDILALRWADCGLTGIFFQQGKTGKKLEVEYSWELLQVLFRARYLEGLPAGEFVVMSRKRRRYTSAGFRAIWQRRMKKLYRSGAIVENLHFHDIRAKTVSDSESLEDAQARAGHTSMAMTRGTYDRGTRKVKPLR